MADVDKLKLNVEDDDDVIRRTSTSAGSEGIYKNPEATGVGIDSDSLQGAHQSCGYDSSCRGDASVLISAADLVGANIGVVNNDHSSMDSMDTDDDDEPGEQSQIEQDNEMKIVPPPASWYLNDENDGFNRKIPENQREGHDDSNYSTSNSDSGGSGTNRMQESNGGSNSFKQITNHERHDGIRANCIVTTKSTTLVSPSKSKTMTPRNTSKPKTKPTTSSTKQDVIRNLKILQHVTTTVLPSAAQELVSSAAQKAYHYTKLSYSNSHLFGKFHLANTEVGNRLGGYDRRTIVDEGIRDAHSKEILWKENMMFDPTDRYGGGNGNGNQIDSRDSDALVSVSDSDNHPTESESGNCTSLARKTAASSLSSSPSGLGWEDEWDKARIALPPFSSLPWVDRQLVKEWRTCDYLTYKGEEEELERSKRQEQVQNHHQQQSGQSNNTESTRTPHSPSMEDSFEVEDFEQARTLQPQPIQKPPWENAVSCYACRKMFGSTLRHHCRLCGRSYCQSHSRWTHRLPHLGYSPDVPERVCAPCKQVLESQNLAERIAWRMARCRDYLSISKDFVPYFDTGLDTVEDVAARLTKAAIHMAKSIPLGAQATMTVETLDVLRKHGLKGVYGLILRKEFLAAADLLCKVTGINKKVWPLSVHELSAAIFYALAQHRALRGVDPEREHRIHALKKLDDIGNASTCTSASTAHPFSCKLDDDDNEQNCADLFETSPELNKNVLVDETDDYDPSIERTTVEEPLLSKLEKLPTLESIRHTATANEQGESTSQNKDDDCQKDLPFDPICDPVSDGLLSSLIFYAPLALNFIYATSEVDMQLLAAQQGWRLMYAHLKQDDGTWAGQIADKPASALFVHAEQKIACFAVRGTATINDVVTDIRAMPIQFPDTEMDGVHKIRSQNEMNEEGWTPIAKGQGLALCGMAGAACNLFRENIDAILLLARKGYRIRLTGHSLGGSCAALLGSLVKRHFEFHLPSNMSKDDEILRVYSYGSPACVDAKLSDYAQSYVINCVLHDDVIPRLTPTSIRALLKHLLYIRETWVKTHLNEDLMAITERAKTVWAPKLRNGFSLVNTGNPSIKVYRKLKAKGRSIKKKMKKGHRKLKAIATTRTCSKNKIDDVDNGECTEEIDAATTLPACSDDREATKDGENNNSALFFEGDCFYEAEEDLIEHSDEESVGEISKNKSGAKSLDGWVPFDEVPFDEPSPNDAGERGVKNDHENLAETANAVFLEETPLPRMFIPGKIVHIYTHYGAYKAALVPRAFRELRRISLAGSMLNDHTSKSYYEALLECKSVREATKPLPVWTGFAEEMTCCCCASRFTWASTSGSEAQEARDRHNCRACGGLVCGPCSNNRVSVPTIGIHAPSRVCDRCYHDMGSVLNDGKLLRRFTKDRIEKKEGSNINDGDEFLHDATLPKRNPLVDELAMRMPSAGVFN